MELYFYKEAICRWCGKKDINTGLSWANRKVGNNIMVILKKGSSKTEQLKIVYQDINKLYNFFGY